VWRGLLAAVARGARMPCHRRTMPGSRGLVRRRGGLGPRREGRRRDPRCRERPGV